MQLHLSPDKYLIDDDQTASEKNTKYNSTITSMPLAMQKWDAWASSDTWTILYHSKSQARRADVLMPWLQRNIGKKSPVLCRFQAPLGNWCNIIYSKALKMTPGDYFLLTCSAQVPSSDSERKECFWKRKKRVFQFICMEHHSSKQSK